ncbi:MAG: FAD-dependent oxidoreductase [Gemmatimonadaceae bacterium]
MLERYTNVGSGIAAGSAAESIRTVAPHARVTMISAEPDSLYSLYSRPALSRPVKGEISQGQLHLRSAEQLALLELERLSTYVRSINRATHEVTTGDGRTLPYDRLLLATGAASLPPSLPGASLRGVVVLDGIRDAHRMLLLARGARAAVVVGGGSTAIEMAEGLNARGLLTLYLMRGGRCWTRVLDEVESGLVESRLGRKGVRLLRHTSVARAVGVHGRLRWVETVEGDKLECDVLAVSDGVRPRVQLAVAAGLDADRGIVTNGFLQTSDADIFAAGDAAQMRDESGRPGTLDTLWTSAEQQGRCAGLNMTGAWRRFVMPLPINVTRLAGVPVTIAGAVGGASDPDLLAITRGQSERWDVQFGTRSVGGRRDDDRLRLVLQDGVVMGVLAMGMEELLRPLDALIGARVPAGVLRQARRAGEEAALDILTGYCNSLRGDGVAYTHAGIAPHPVQLDARMESGA